MYAHSAVSYLVAVSAIVARKKWVCHIGGVKRQEWRWGKKKGCLVVVDVNESLSLFSFQLWAHAALLPRAFLKKKWW